MAVKRGNKEGTIYRKSNGKWRAQVSIPGGRLSYTAKTHAEALEWLRSNQNQAEVGLTHKGSKLTFGMFLTEWLETTRQRRAISTAYSYEQLTRTYIRPALGKIKLRELTPSVIQQFYNQRIAEGVGHRTVAKAHNVIHASLSAAVKMGLIGRNPDDATDPPKSTPKEMSFLKPDEVRNLLKKALELDSRNYALYFTAVATGMRQGELLALRWENVDLERCVLRVKQSLVRLPNGGLKLQRPKTKSSIRSIRLGKETIAVLKEQEARLIGEKEKSNGLWKDLGFVFPSTIGTPADPTNVLKQFRKTLQAAGLPKIRFHDLRHTAASLMLNNGVDVLVASKRLGHAKPSITLDVYGHLIPSIQEEAADVLDRLITV